MEHFDQNYGYILYRTELPAAVHGDLAIKDVHDFAAAYINGKLIGTMDRRNADPQGNIRPVAVATTGPARLDILVANDGRVNVDHTMRTETKGITQFVVLDGRSLSDWRVYPLPMESPPTTRQFTPTQATDSPNFRRGKFQLDANGDTFLDISKLGKGVVWINGHNLGRYWNTGPQQTLYVPAPWLKTGANEIVVFDMLPTSHETVTGFDHPILDAHVNDRTTSNQE
jgi:beta-galactosidase